VKKIVGIIPARYASTRFPGKPLVKIFGREMILHVVDRAQKCGALHEVIVATDDQRIFDLVNDAGKKVVMTSVDHVSGTDRCLEAFTSACPDADAIINIQGDEPFIKPEQIEALAELIQKDEVDIASLCVAISDSSWLSDPNKVKVVLSDQGKALYFSRQAIPYVRSAPQHEWLSHHAYYKHLGLYAYKSSVLKSICKLEISSLERAESLEQLRWLQSGYGIYLAITPWETPAIDTPSDLEVVLSQNSASFE
jgi:3-deoxy-manno-octulosonate cytidylyltransferase (CMP-KDO synthetase)